MNLSGWRAALASALTYIGLTALMGRVVLGSLNTAIASDQGDPLLNAGILVWNATTLPFSEAWWQFPSFYPTRDTLAFTENLLGVSPVSSPLYWLTGDGPTTYNLTMLLSYPLCGMAMYALACRLTRSAAAAFLAGLAFAFAPYRASHLPHLQLLVLFWAPLSLVGLHAFLDTGRRRWLALFGTAWALQGLANAYMLVIFSSFIGAWVLWFVVAQRRWRDAAMIAGATALAALPLLPLIRRYLSVHALHGLYRPYEETAAFGADIAAVFCASPRLTFWGWLDRACPPESMLFAGAGLIALCAAGVAAAWASSLRGATASRAVHLLKRAVTAAILLYLVIIASLVVAGPWQATLGPISVSISNPTKYLSVLLALLAVAGLLSSRVLVLVQQSSVPGFYLLAALMAWVLTWGPTPRLFGQEVLYAAPFQLLVALPGFNGLRVPPRFWVIAVLSLTVLMAIVTARWMTTRRRGTATAAVVVTACVLIADG